MNLKKLPLVPLAVLVALPLGVVSGCGQKDDSKAGIESSDIVFKMPPGSKFNTRKKQEERSNKNQNIARGGD